LVFMRHPQDIRYKNKLQTEGACQCNSKKHKSQISPKSCNC
jgi:hypothetical protein